MASALKGMLEKRRVRKRGREVLRHIKHVRCYKEDIAKAEDLAQLASCEKNLSLALKDSDTEATKLAIDSVARCCGRISPPRKFSGLRENLEIIVVAIVVAMGIRTYFIQPFKIPTGSMQPSLYGIHGEEVKEAHLMDKFPLSAVRWLITGVSYREIVVKQAGRLQRYYPSAKPGLIEWRIGASRYFVPKSDRLDDMQGYLLPTGTILWRGRQKAGDHVFVNKVAWNFLRPRRGDVMVFSTDGIEGLPEGTHYIKRMVGLPNESISIDAPYVVSGADRITEPYSIARVTAAKDGYDGYMLTQRSIDPVTGELPLLFDKGQSIDLGSREYLAFGDNTDNSKDSRYWGTVPQQNLVGPAFLVYWPYSSERWGFIPGH
jgi:signal peptidase I